MRYIEVGIDGSGRSSVVREASLDAGSATLHSAAEAASSKRPATTPAIDAHCPPGTSVWKVWEAAPGMVAGLHRTDTIDYDTVMSGNIVLVLENGEIELHTGDCVVLPGVMHGWRSGPNGSRLSVIQLGIEPVV
jgi:quercetin dioxygenase-like cupin family protein